jgi:hypothetical protein
MRRNLGINILRADSQDIDITSMSVQLPSSTVPSIVPYRIWGSCCALIAMLLAN